MRGIYTPVTDIRRKVFTEVARMAYEVNELSDYEKLMRELPFKIIPGEEKSLRSSIFLERAIISERVRLAMGMSLRPLDESVPASEGLEHSVIADKYYEPPLINVIKFACNACPEKVIKVTAMCQGCLAHPCQEVCPKHAISFRNGKSHIDQSLCVKCGRCVNSCPYSAIVKTQRRATALKNVVIPNLESTVKFISDSLDEKDREEFSRLKVIKAQKTAKAKRLAAAQAEAAKAEAAGE